MIDSVVIPVNQKYSASAKMPTVDPDVSHVEEKTDEQCMLDETRTETTITADVQMVMAQEGHHQRS